MHVAPNLLYKDACMTVVHLQLVKVAKGCAKYAGCAFGQMISLSAKMRSKRSALHTGQLVFFCTALVCAAGIAALQTAGGDAAFNVEKERQKWVLRENELGVTQASLSGTMRTRAGDEERTEDVTVHFFLKGILRGGQLLVRGFWFVESLENRELWGNGHDFLSMPPEALDWQPRIFLKARNLSTEHNFVLDRLGGFEGNEFGQSRRHMPFSMALALPEDAAKEEFELRVASWTDMGIYSPAKHNVPLRSEYNVTEPVSEVWVLISPPFGNVEPQMAAELLCHHVEYHQRLGFTGTIQYVGPDMLVSFLMHEGIKRLIQEKQLQLVLWDRVIGCNGHEKCYPPYNARYLLEYPYSEQTMVYSHGFLAHWGRNVMLAVVDVDEYLAIMEPQRSIMDLVESGCVARQRHATFLRFNMVAEGGRVRDKSEWEAVWQNKSYAIHPLQLYLRRRGQAYTRDHGKAQNTRYAIHPLQLYLRRRVQPYTRDHGKTLAHPEALGAYNIHMGGIASRALTGREPDEYFPVPESCAFVIHLPNLLRPRTGPNKLGVRKYHRETRWQWVFDEWDKLPHKAA